MKKFKLFWIWQDEIEERWLQDLALEGCHLESIAFPGFYRFSSGKPKKISICLGFLKSTDGNLQNDLDTIHQSGWEHIGRMKGWQYLRKSAEDREKQAILDIQKTKAEKFQRMMTFLVGFLPMMLIGFPVIARKFPPPYQYIVIILLGLIIIAYTISAAKIYQRIAQLRDI